MPSSIDRRTFLGSAGTLAALAALGTDLKAQEAAGLVFSEPRPFAFDALVARAENLAKQAYVPPPKPSPEITSQLNYDYHGQIRFKTDLSLWKDGPSRFPVTFFHLGQFFQKRVVINVVEKGEAREILYRERYFDMPPDNPARALPDGAGFAGFRFQEPSDGALDWQRNDWVAFLGASYFRSIGELFQYGLSARGIVVNSANPNPPFNEEFPDFVEFWLEPVADPSNQVRVYALLDGPSITGAYSFLMTRDKAVVMDIDARLFTRNDIYRLGLAPLTSMYWYSESRKTTAIDWRPEIHDSDGLAIWTGAGERIWRPLNNPPQTMVSTFVDTDPKGFGLSQRDRAFDNYLDGVHYERRPTLWVEPLEPFGEGAVQLIEIPTDDEIHDNIVAIWRPKEPVVAGQSFKLNYRLHWAADESVPNPLARCVATRLGNGGQPGTTRPKGVRKFVVEFLGGTLADLPFGVKPEAVLTASRGTFSYVFTEAVPNDVPGHWRAQFDLTVEGSEPVELRCYLRLDGKALTETWLYQYHPF